MTGAINGAVPLAIGETLEKLIYAFKHGIWLLDLLW